MQSKNAIKLSVLLAAYSAQLYSSDYTYGQTNNAANVGLNWVMSNVLPEATGLDVNGVIYRYTTVKNPADPMKVYVQNEDAINGGYIFRETDDWSGLPGGSINKLVPVDNIPYKYWGDGSIEVDGIGSVEDAYVAYTYRFRPCQDESCAEPVEIDLPEIDIPEIEDDLLIEVEVFDDSKPTPTTVDPRDVALSSLTMPEIDIYDPMQDALVDQATQPTDPMLYDNDQIQQNYELEKEDDMEWSLSVAENAVALADGVTQASVIQAMNVVSLGSYYAASIDGGTYGDTLTLRDSDIPDNKRAFRSMSEQKLHNDLINLQYGK